MPDWPWLGLHVKLNEDAGPKHAKFKHLYKLAIKNPGFNIKISTDNVNKLAFEGESITWNWLDLIAKNRNMLHFTFA